MQKQHHEHITGLYINPKAEGANLKMAEGLTIDQLKDSTTNTETILPESLNQK